MMLSAKQVVIKRNHKILCQHLNLYAQAGDFWGILGPNGSGKTSLLHTLGGMHPAAAGEIRLNDDNIKHLSPRSIAKQLAILFQDTHFIFPQTVWNYCLTARYPHLPYFKKESEQDRQIVMNALDVTDLTQHTPRAVTALSGGEKRRLAIAAVLAQTPDIFLLDEPVNHLDMRHQTKVLTHFHQLAILKSKIVIASLHDLNWAQQFCNRILLLFQDGSVLQGQPHEVMTIENLSQLYQQPLKQIPYKDTYFWCTGISAP